MNEQIKQTHRGQFNVEGSLQVRTEDAPTGAESRRPYVPQKIRPFHAWPHG